MTLRRTAAVITAIPLALYIYACSDDASGTPDTSNGDAGQTVDSGGGSSSGDVVTDGGVTEDGGTDAGDAGDSGLPVACLGNPLTEDGGTVTGGVTLDAGVLKVIATGPFLDGPQWLDEGDAGPGAIVYSEVFAQTIVRNAPGGGDRTVLGSTGDDLPVGNGRGGDFLFTSVATPGGGGGIRKMLPDGGTAQGFDAGPARSPNDLVVSSKGIVYFTDPAYQASEGNPVTGVYKMAPDGKISVITQFNGGGNPGDRADGIALSHDEKALYVGFSDAKRIDRYTIDESGDASNPQPFPFTPTENPTGIAIDLAGNLWIAENHASLVSGRIEVVDPTGKKWGEIPFTDSRPTGIAFGGSDGTTVYVTTERENNPGTLYVLDTRCPGVR